MTSTEEKIAVMQAFVEGRTIDAVEGDNEFSFTKVCVPAPIWDWRNRQYSVAKLEAVMYATLDNGKIFYLYYDEETAMQHMGEHKVIKVNIEEC